MFNSKTTQVKSLLAAVALPAIGASLFGLFLFWLLQAVTVDPSSEVSYSRSDCPENEREAILALRDIFKAQLSYRKNGIDPDFPGHYSRFLPHLFKQPAGGEMLEIRLLPRDPAQAISSRRSVNGYYFKMLRYRRNPAGGPKIRLDYSREWAVVAVPADPGYSGRFLIFLDQTAAAYMVNSYASSEIFPDPAAPGLKKIDIFTEK